MSSGAGDHQEVILLAGARGLAIDGRQVVRIAVRLESVAREVAPQGVVGDAEDVELVAAVEVDELGDW